MTQPQPTLAELLAQLAGGDQEGRWAAARALGARGERAAVPALCAALQDRDHTLVWEAAEALGLIGDPAAVPALVEAFSPAAYQAFVPALARIGGEAARASLVALARDRDAVLGRSALSALVRMGAMEALAVALEVVRAASPMRLEAFEAVQTFAGPADVPAAREALLDALRASLDTDVRWGVRVCLAHLARHDLASIVELLAAEEWLVRRTAALALGDVGGAEVVAPLRAALADPDPLVRWGAAQALAAIDLPAADAALAAARDDPDPLVQQTARRERR